MPNEILIPLQSLVSCFLEHPTNRWDGWQWVQLRDSGEAAPQHVPKALSAEPQVAVTQAGEGSSVLTLLCAKDQTNENCKHWSDI